MEERFSCPSCNKNSSIFCKECLVLSPLLEGSIPKICLKIPLHIIQHPLENRSKSTALHAMVIAPISTTIQTFDPINGIIDYNPTETVLLFPSKESKGVEEIDWATVKTIIVLDGTWQQATGMAKNPILSPFLKRSVHLSLEKKTLFWRYQNIGENALSTIEAIHTLYKEIGGGGGDEEIDNLLIFFLYQYSKIQKYYRDRPEKKYTQKHRENYIKK